jgi:hypothetical protein
MDEFPAADRIAAEVFCGGSSKVSCVYDYLVTRDEQVAALTNTFEDSLDAEMRKAGAYLMLFKLVLLRMLSG